MPLDTLAEALSPYRLLRSGLCNPILRFGTHLPQPYPAPAFGEFIGTLGHTSPSVSHPRPITYAIPPRARGKGAVPRP